jgi:hypothetical protein
VLSDQLPPCKYGHCYALPLAVDIPVNNKGNGGIYTNDSIFICPDLKDNIEKIAKAIPLAKNSFDRL